jgi:23S rRNA pseudouridine1911/1915/1917 synthase
MTTLKNRLHKAVKELVNKQYPLEYSRPQIANFIEKYGVFVDGVLLKKRLDWVLVGQKIALNNWPKIDSGNFDDIKVLWEDNDLILLFKPAGVVVQPGASHGQKNLTSWLQNNYENQKKFDPVLYPSGGLINRLDKETQGLILVAKSIDSKEFFQNQFRQRTVEKKYLTVLGGVLENQVLIKNWQSRSLSNPTKQILFWDEKEALKYSPNSRYAESIFQPLYLCKELSLTICQVTIKTGRMHQIRLQAQAISLPVLGDTKYNQKPKTNSFQKYLAIQKSEPKNNNLEDFLDKKKFIFGNADFCLLSNYIKIALKNNSPLVFTYKNLP